MSADDLLHIQKNKEEPKERTGFRNSKTWFAIAGCSAALLLLFKKANSGHEL